MEFPAFRFDWFIKSVRPRSLSALLAPRLAADLSSFLTLPPSLSPRLASSLPPRLQRTVEEIRRRCNTLTKLITKDAGGADDGDDATAGPKKRAPKRKAKDAAEGAPGSEDVSRASTPATGGAGGTPSAAAAKKPKK